MTAKEILTNICQNNIHLLDEPEVKEIEAVLNKLLNTIPSQEQFDTISDLRMFLRLSKHDRTDDCLHYLGDKAQIWYHNNGWNEYRMAYDNYEKRHVKPSVTGKYLVCRKDGKIHFENYNGTGFAYNDNSIIYWQEIPKMPNKPTLL